MPVVELQQIDELWVRFSQGKFGFSVQSRIWQEVGGAIGVDSSSAYGEFALRVGWQKAMGSVPAINQSPSNAQEQVAAFFNRLRGPKMETVYETVDYPELTFDISAPPGHLPFPGAMTHRDFSTGRSRAYTDSWDVPYMSSLVNQFAKTTAA